MPESASYRERCCSSRTRPTGASARDAHMRIGRVHWSTRRLGYLSEPMLQVQFFEDALRDVADDEHDWLEDAGHVEVVLLRVDGLDDGRGDLVDIGLLDVHVRRHRDRKSVV